MHFFTYLASKYVWKYVVLAFAPPLLASTSGAYHLSSPDGAYMISTYILATYFACMLKFGFPKGGGFSSTKALACVLRGQGYIRIQAYFDSRPLGWV